MESGLSKRELLHANIIRDADKLDIMYLISIYKQTQKPEGKVNDIVLKSFWNKELINKKYIKNESDRYLQKIALVFDLNFRKSFEIVKEKNYIDKMTENLYLDDNVRDFIKKYVEDKINRGEF